MSTHSTRLIKAYKHGWPRFAVESMVRSKARGGFHQVLAQGLDRFRESLNRDPAGTLILANHSCWWDLFVYQVVNDALEVDGYGMMEHFNLLRFGFFRRIGAFSVDRTDPVSVRASLRYAAELLQKPKAVVWVFPQGKIESNDVRPLKFQNGIRAIIRQAAPVQVLPLAIRYEFWQDERPEVLIRFGERFKVDRADLPDLIPTFERRLTEELDALRMDAIAQRPDRFVPLMTGQTSVSDRYARFRARFRGPTPGAPT
ncbi:lysophospholipid acyltransferase family protein [Tundrisphaera lichenicola]|uniref:lysophospholipid acyltransferase family protein n=1 Tax=Tundrisphaera lichenicola TaxID=2029860 RepID=UPI003EB98B1E